MLEDGLMSEKRIQNVDTGMDISVVGYKEVPGPLGGVSVEYAIKVDTTRLEFKNSFQRDTSVIRFTVHKTFKEIEYFQKKIKGKHANVKIPDLLQSSSSAVDVNLDARQKVADSFMKFLAKDNVFCASPVLFSFLGYDAERNMVSCESLHSTPQSQLPSQEVPPNKQSNSKPTWNKESDNMFLGSALADRDEDEEDVFQEFKRQNLSEAPSLFTESPLKKQQQSVPSKEDSFFLFSRQEMGGALKSDDIDRLLIPFNTKEQSSSRDATLAPPQLDDLAVNAELLKIDDSLSDILNEMKPKKSRENPEINTVKPEVTAAKPEVKKTPKPALAPKPSLPAKKPSTAAPLPIPGDSKPVPAPRAKPVPLPRTASSSGTPSCSSSAGTTTEQSAAVTAATDGKQTKKPSVSDDLTTIDILSYIDLEQKAQNELATDLELFP